MGEAPRKLMLAIATLCVMAGPAAFGRPQAADPATIAQAIGDRIVADTVFHLEVQPANGLQQGFYPLAAEPGDAHNFVLFAADIDCRAHCAEAPVDLRYAASPGDLRILVDGREIFRTRIVDPIDVRERDYNVVDVPIAKRDFLASGPSRLVIMFRPEHDDGFVLPGLTFGNGIGAQDKVTLRPAGLTGSLDKSVRFLRTRIASESELPAALADLDARASAGAGAANRWRPVRRVDRLQNADPLAISDWRYFSGAIQSAMLETADRFDRPDFENYVARHVAFFLDNIEIVRAERAAKHQLDGPFAHYFRFALLDDVGPQATAMIEWNARLPERSRVARIDALIAPAIDAILGVPRLADGTMARLTPSRHTIWADDLYMGAASLVRIGTLMHRPDLLDEAARQALLFDRHLRDDRSGLYFHGWFETTASPSSSKWARANGWTMLAKLQILKALPADHPDRPALQRAFAAHASALKAAQSPDGRWHQVLDNQDTYLETSATAMFVAAMAEGVTRRWLDAATFDPVIARGWAAVAKQVRPDGRVEGIVVGTPILSNDDEYNAQKIRLNDPRGLAAMLFASIAVADWQAFRAAEGRGTK
ncbi:rhamnogalacturonyl hydrolase YesR [Hephaestia caeni]|uniref:Rhamnogalacturonyl hydrolase YesR n=1 Tax=Hephaestia caeni TaxID=645617 RepID=A0A397PGE7_9SPHN|nr:glycoside hydrolase family 88 protein [Hephaestia caeni]RIA46939.1 rhamnogalacturonyl hydrolase YesR [Hephaestia caeni]